MSSFEQSLEKLLQMKNLSYDEAYGAMYEIMSGNVPPARLASWLSLLKAKGETADEIGGCAAAMREKAVKIHSSRKDIIDTCGTGGDGGSTFNISTASAIIASGAGLAVAKHGNRAVSGKSGSADVFEKLGVNITIPPERVENCLNEIGLAFLFAPNFHPAMKYAAPVRKELGFRTIFNLLGPLCNPAGVKRAVIGVYSRNLCRLITEAAIKLGYDGVLVVHSDDGLDEISLCAKTHICEFRNGKFAEYEFDPTEYGFSLCKKDEISGGDAEENAKIILQILNKKEECGAKAKVAILNAGAAIFASGMVDSWESAIARAKESLNSGTAQKKLEDLINFCR